MKYQYEIFPFGNGWPLPEREKKMNEMSANGWEVFHISNPVPQSYEFSLCQAPGLADGDEVSVDLMTEVHFRKPVRGGKT